MFLSNVDTATVGAYSHTSTDMQQLYVTIKVIAYQLLFDIAVSAIYT